MCDSTVSMKFKIRYKYIQGKTDITEVVETCCIDNARKIGHKLFPHDNWNHFIHVDPAPPTWKTTIDEDGNDIREKKEATSHCNGRDQLA